MWFVSMYFLCTHTSLDGFTWWIHCEVSVLLRHFKKEKNKTKHEYCNGNEAALASSPCSWAGGRDGGASGSSFSPGSARSPPCQQAWKEVGRLPAGSCRLRQGTDVCLYKHRLLALSGARGTWNNPGAPCRVFLSAFGKARHGQAESWAERRTVRFSRGECGVLQLGGG